MFNKNKEAKTIEVTGPTVNPGETQRAGQDIRGRNDEVKGKYDTDSPATHDQAEELLKEYYKNKRNDLPPNAKRPVLESWKLNEDGTLVVVDGTSGRKLEFIVNEEVREEVQAIITAEDAETAALDAEAEANEAEAQALVAEQKAKAAREKANQKPFAYIDKAAKDFGPKGATNAANATTKSNEQYKAELKAKEEDRQAKAKAKEEEESKAKAKAGK